MSKRVTQRRIILLVEGETEEYLGSFLGRWVNQRLPRGKRVGVRVMSFGGVDNLLKDMIQTIELVLTKRSADFVIGLVDLYGLDDRLNLSGCNSVDQKVAKAREIIERRVPKRFRPSFCQHFAVHEIEAWLLAYPERWPEHLRPRIMQRRPEEVNFSKPPARFLQEVLGGRYKKTADARRIFDSVDAQVAIDLCPHLNALADDLLRIAARLTQ